MAKQQTTTLTDDMKREAIREHLREAGRKGGQAMKRRGRAYYQAIGRKGAAKRWKNKKKK